MKGLLRVLQVRAGEGRLLTCSAAWPFSCRPGGSLGGNAIDALFFARFGTAYPPPLHVVLGISTP